MTEQASLFAWEKKKTWKKARISVTFTTGSPSMSRHCKDTENQAIFETDRLFFITSQGGVLFLGG